MLTTVSNGIQHVRSGGVASSAVIYAGGSQYVGWAADGGTSGRAGDTTISGGRQVLVSGYVFGTTILNDGVQEISNGSARLTSVCSGAQNVSSGGTADETHIYAGGSQNVFYGGLAAYTTVNSGGIQYIQYGGSSLYGTVRYGGIQHIMSGTATSVAIYGSQTIYQSGIAENNFVYDAVQDISSGGLARNTNIEWRGSQIISSGGRAENAVITNYAGSQTILNGGIASGTEVFEGLQ